MSPIPTVSNMLGPLSIGTPLASIIYGINCLQLYLYYMKYSQRDGALLKAYVAVLMVADSLHVALLMLIHYHYTVVSFGDKAALESTFWPLLAQVLLGVCGV
ncbi:hypothetical protein DAEQUDRAFT_320166 [Daedalea quercina L-15889]|uniref:Uncharacterized protein n=1 Tax=Daedalea quercina L-15889 TaxID=1314783 RepID=A0A165PRQ5_9APHY|nr:hypothetical protein DAEQUDRAFT_320166 [Daedalea quercina L-15889]